MHQAINRRPRTCLRALGGLAFALNVGCSSDGPGGPAAAPQAGGPGVAGGAATTGGGTGSGPIQAPAGGTASGAGGSTAPPERPPPVQSPPSSQACPTERVPFTPLRRLTRYEYANSARALLGVDPTGATADIPVDEVTNGFSNNSAVQTVSPLHAEKYVLASEALAKQAVQNLSTLFPCDTVAKGEEACAREFARSFGRRAFRRALTQQDETMLMSAYAAGKTGGTYAEGIEVIIRALLQSPGFIYRLESTPPADAAAKLIPLSQYELATRLAYTIWGTGPDDALLDAAQRGELSTKEQVSTTARAMLADPKARVGVVEFFSQWMGTSRLAITSKNTTLFPKYSNAVRAGLMQELPAFMEHVLWSGDHSFATLLTSQLAFVTPATAPLYGVTPPGTGDTPQMVTLPPSQGRAGVLTQAGFLAVQAHPDQTSPVLRGKFVRATLLCTPPPSPPPDVDVSPPKSSDGATARERAAAHSELATCKGCHTLMDPIGLAFENFDALGEHRLTEAGNVIDVSGQITGVEAPLSEPFVGVRELADKLAGSDLVRDCLSTQWFRFALGRSEAEADGCSRSVLQERFEQSNGDLLELVVGLAETDAFLYRGPSGQ